MDLSRLLSALALGLAGCTSVLGIDGDFEVDGGSGGGATTTGAGSSTTASGTPTSSGTAGGDGGGSTTSTTTTSGGGGAGGEEPASTSSSSTSTGAGGDLPFPPGTCARCAAPTTFRTENAARPRIAHLSNFVRLSYVTETTAVFATDGQVPVSFPSEGAHSAIALVDHTFTGPHNYWSRDTYLLAAGDLAFENLETGWIVGARTSSRVYIGAVGIDDRPALLDCATLPKTFDVVCTVMQSQACTQGAVLDDRRVVDVDRTAGPVAFGRICGDRIQVSYPPAGPADTFDEPADGATEIAIASGLTGLHVLAILDGGTPEARVRMYRTGYDTLTVAAPGASSPTMAAITGEGAVGAFADGEGLVIVSCTDGPACTFERLVSDEDDGASEPSIGVYLVGPEGDVPDPWIAWERDGGIHHGLLTSPD